MQEKRQHQQAQRGVSQHSAEAEPTDKRQHNNRQVDTDRQIERFDKVEPCLQFYHTGAHVRHGIGLERFAVGLDARIESGKIPLFPCRENILHRQCIRVERVKVRAARHEVSHARLQVGPDKLHKFFIHRE